MYYIHALHECWHHPSTESTDMSCLVPIPLPFDAATVVLEDDLSREGLNLHYIINISLCSYSITQCVELRHDI